MSKKVSIVVPCYNLEALIGRCLDSLCAQTYRDLEIIVVDDGSVDGSMQVLCSYAEKDSRIRPVSQNNGGPSAARNYGMDLATGDYLMFVDGDDYVDNTYVQHFVEAAQDCQLVISGQRYVYSDGREVSVPEAAFCCTREEYVQKHYLHSIKNRTIFGPYIKLYDRQLLERYRLRFDESIAIHEDAIFVMQVLARADRICGIPCTEYCYVQHAPNMSLVTKFHYNEQQINNCHFELMVGLIGQKKLRDEEICCLHTAYLNTSIATVRKLYRSREYTLRRGLSYIRSLLRDETFCQARLELKRVAPKKARKYYRPLLVVHAINYLAVKLKK